MGKLEVKYQVPSYVIIGIIIIVIFQFGVSSFRNFQLEQYADEFVNWNRDINPAVPDIWEVQNRVYEKAKLLGLPVQHEMVLITHTELGLAISIDYVSKVNLFIKQVPWKHQIRVETGK